VRCDNGGGLNGQQKRDRRRRRSCRRSSRLFGGAVVAGGEDVRHTTPKCVRMACRALCVNVYIVVVIYTTYYSIYHISS